MMEVLGSSDPHEGGEHHQINGHRTTIDLALDIRHGHASNIYIYDHGHLCDEHTYTANWAVEGREWVYPRGRNEGVEFPVHIKPFGAHLKTSPVFAYPEYRGKYGQGDGEYSQWFVRAIPADTAQLEIDIMQRANIPVTGFRFGTIQNCPVPLCIPNDSYRIVYNRHGSGTREYDTGAWTEKKIATLEWADLSEADASCILHYITRDVRGWQFSVDFGDLDRMAVWRDLNDTVVDVRLHSSEVSILCDGGDRWSISIEVINV